MTRRPAKQILFLVVVSIASSANLVFAEDWGEVQELIGRDFPDIPTMSTSDLADRIKSQTDSFLLLDVREKSEFKVSRIPGAQHASLSDIAFFADIPKDKKLIVYCSVGYRSAGFVEQLQNQGFTNVLNLEGSIFAWANEGRSLENDHGITQYVHPFDDKWGKLLKKELHPKEYQPVPYIEMSFLQKIRSWNAVVLLILFLLWESFCPYFVFFKKNYRDRFRHALWNIIIGALNSLLMAFGFVFIWTWAVKTADENSFGLLKLIPQHLLVARVVCAVLLLDLWTYWWHRWNHHVPFLWRFHRMHHSDPKMDVTTAVRFHIGEIFFSSSLRVPLFFLLGVQLWEVAVYEILMFSVVAFHHANIGLPPTMDKIIRVFIVTPEIHKVHHSKESHEMHSNYASFLSFWDRIFGSFQISKDSHEIEFGLAGFDTDEKQSLVGLMKTPLENEPDAE